MTAATLDGLPDVDGGTPEANVIVQIPLDAWRIATTWIAGSKPRGPEDPMDQISIRFQDHPQHYTDTWTKQPITDPAVTLAVTDKYRYSYATIEDLGNPDPFNKMRYLSHTWAGTVSVDASDALKAMRGWPSIATKETGAHAVEIEWDNDRREVAVTLFNAETSQKMATSILPLFDGLHEFPTTVPDVTTLPDPVGMFAVNPGHLKALMGAASGGHHEHLQIRAHDRRLIAIRADPIDLEAVTVHCTAMVTSKRLAPAEPDHQEQT